METKSPEDIAVEIGAPTVGLLGTQDWASALHSGVTVSELHYADGGGCIPFRVVDNGVVTSLLQDEGAPGDVQAVYQKMLGDCQAVELNLRPALYAAIKDLDPGADVVRGLTVGGKEMIADVIGGQIANLREPPGQPKFTVDKAGKVAVDLSDMSAANKLIAQTVIAASPVGANAAVKG